MTLTIEDRKLVDQANAKYPNKDDSDYGFTTQGREYFRLGLGKISAKYPNDTYVGSFRLLGWHLEKLEIEVMPEIPAPPNIEVGSRCLFDGTEHQIYAFGDGMVLLSPTDRRYEYHSVVASYEKLSSITPRTR